MRAPASWGGIEPWGFSGGAWARRRASEVAPGGGPTLAGIQAHHVEAEARTGRLGWIEGVLRGCAPQAGGVSAAPVGAVGGEA